MTRLTDSTKHLVLELHVNDDRNTLQLIEQIAKTLNIASSTKEQVEYVQLMHVRHINKEAVNAKTGI